MADESSLSDQLDIFIHSEPFIQGFIRLFKYAREQGGVEWTHVEEKLLVGHLRNISFKDITEPNSIEGNKSERKQSAENKEAPTSVYIKTFENSTSVFFDTSIDGWLENLTLELSNHLNETANNDLEGNLLTLLKEILGMSETPEQISECLSKKGVCSYPTNQAELEDYPKPGTFLPKEYHQFLDANYEISESDYKFMVLELDDPAITEDTEDVADGDARTQLDPTYIFVHIKQKVESNETSHALLKLYEIDDGSESPLTVKACSLFKFGRENEGSQVDNSKNIKENKTVADADLEIVMPEFLESTFREIEHCLDQAWKEQLVYRRIIVKRLLLRWNPDKMCNKDLGIRIFKHIQKYVFQLEMQKDDSESGGSLEKQREKIQTNNVFLGRMDKDEEMVYKKHVKKEPPRCAEEFWSQSWYGHCLERRGQAEASVRTGRGFDVFDGAWQARPPLFQSAETQPYHYTTEARRWQRQAHSDLENSESALRRSPNNSNNWVCYMAHQAAEKSLKAAWYAKDANKVHNVRYGHNLCYIASGLGQDVEKLARDLTRLTGEHTRMRYPDALYGQQIPAEAFNRQTAGQAVDIAGQIFHIVQMNHIGPVRTGQKTGLFF